MSKTGSKLNNYWLGFRSKGPFSIIGLIFIMVAFFVIIPSLFLLDRLLKDPYERYNYKEIVDRGESKNARITGITVKKNVTFNGIHPRVIAYEYLHQGAGFADKFQTLEVEQVDSLSKKDSINVFVLNKESVIGNLKPYTFPFMILWPAPAIFLVFGIPMFCFGHLAGWKKVRNVGGF